MKQAIKRSKNNPYLGHNSAEFTHQNKTHRTSSEAFRDAQYASWFERDAEMSDMKKFISDMLWIAPSLSLLIYAVRYVISIT